MRRGLLLRGRLLLLWRMLWGWRLLLLRGLLRRGLMRGRCILGLLLLQGGDRRLNHRLLLRGCRLRHRLGLPGTRQGLTWMGHSGGRLARGLGRRRGVGLRWVCDRRLRLNSHRCGRGLRGHRGGSREGHRASSREGCRLSGYGSGGEPRLNCWRWLLRHRLGWHRCRLSWRRWGVGASWRRSLAYRRAARHAESASGVILPPTSLAHDHLVHLPIRTQLRPDFGSIP